MSISRTMSRPTDRTASGSTPPAHPGLRPPRSLAASARRPTDPEWKPMAGAGRGRYRHRGRPRSELLRQLLELPAGEIAAERAVVARSPPQPGVQVTPEDAEAAEHPGAFQHPNGRDPEQGERVCP